MHYEAPAASRLDEEMAQFLSWFETDLKLDPVLRAGIAHLWFFYQGSYGVARTKKALTE